MTGRKKSRYGGGDVLGCLVILAAMMSLFWSVEPQAADLGMTDHHLTNATFIYSVAQFTRWPANAFPRPSSPLVFCSYQDKATGLELAALIEGNTIKGRKLKYKDIVQYVELEHCHVVFFPLARLEKNLPVEVYGAYGVLTISDSEKFVNSGGMLGFELRPGGPDLYLNAEVMRESGLGISPGLLKLAEISRINRKLDGFARGNR